MDIIITEKAKSFLDKSRRKNIVIYLHERICWGGHITKSVVVAALKEYENKNNYQIIPIGEYILYLDQKLFIKKEGLVIDLDPFMFLKQLKQSGASVYEV